MDHVPKKQNLKRKVKEKFTFRGSGASHNQSDSNDSPHGGDQHQENQDSTPFENATSFDSQVHLSELPVLASAPSDTQQGPSCLPGGSSKQSELESRISHAQIHELWDLAYDNLRESDGQLIQGYEAKLDRNITAGLGSIVGLTLGSRSARRDQMNTILQRKMDEVNRDTWKLKFGTSEVQVKDLVQPVLGVVSWANEYISAALSANPSASLAWGGVSLLLPLFLNPSEQAASMAKGLEYISSLIVQGRMWETLYTRRCESNISQIGHFSPLSTECIAFKQGLEKLYQGILKFQIASYCYYDSNASLRLGQDMIKWHGWDDLLKEIQKHAGRFAGIITIWKDITYEEERSAEDRRHLEAIRRWQIIGTDVSALLHLVKDAKAESKRQELLDWLCKVDPSEAYNAARDKHMSGTSDWLIKSTEFKTWETSFCSLLWLNGKPGCGKSVLSSSVVKYLRDQYASDPRTAVAYFFLSFNDLEKQKVNEMLASILKQIYARRPCTSESVQSLLEYKTRGERPDNQTLEAAISATAHGFAEVFVVIDALDECPALVGERDKLLTSLRRIVATMPDNLHILCTSRAEPDIVTMMNTILSGPSTDKIALTSYWSSLNDDIGLYIDNVLASDAYASWPSGLKEAAKESLITNADGMEVTKPAPSIQSNIVANCRYRFQYIFCQLEALQILDSVPLVREELQRLPLGLDATYERLLLGLSGRFQNQIVGALKWLASSNRDLSLEELAEIFILDPNSDVAFDEENRLFNPAGAIKHMSSLIVIQSVPMSIVERISEEVITEVTYVRLAHFTVKEYLMSDRIAEGPARCFSFSETDAHLHIAHSSLAYHFHCIDHGHQNSQYDLLDYASTEWMSHLEMVPPELWPADASNLAARALGMHSKSLRTILQPKEYTPKTVVENWMYAELSKRPHLFTALQGYTNLTNFLISGGLGTNPYFTQDDLDLALPCGAAGGCTAVVELLLDKGADCNADYGEMADALHAAASTGHVAIVDVLLDRGANINAQHGVWGSALQAAISNFHLDVVRLLVRRGSDVNAISNVAACAMTSATPTEQKGYDKNLECLRFLLDSGADINGQCPTRGAALHYAAANSCRWGNNKCVRLLLERGADVNLQGGEYGYPLEAMCYGSVDPLDIKLLLDRGADVNARGGKYDTAFQALFSNESVKSHPQREIAKLLLDKGASVNTQGGFYGSPLQAACATRIRKENEQHGGGHHGDVFQASCSQRSYDAAQFLLDNGANVNAFGGEFGTALQAAATERDSSRLLTLLLTEGAEVNTRGGRYGTALQAACVGGNIDNARILLEHGAEVNAEGGEYGTALQAACHYSHEPNLGPSKIPHLLIEHGADVHRQGGKFGSAWHAAAAGRCDGSVLQLLLEHGIDINDARGRKYATALHAAVESEPLFDSKQAWRIGRIDFLLEHGANMNIGGGDYGLPLQSACAIEEYHGEILTECLLENSADVNVNAAGGIFGSALQAAAHSGQTESVRLLLEKGANVNAAGGKFGSALQAAAHSGQTDSVHLLLNNGANVNVSGGIHRNALNAAILKGYWGIVEILLDKGAIPDSQLDEEWLKDVRSRLGRGAEERYRKFWEKTGRLWKDEACA